MKEEELVRGQEGLPCFYEVVTEEEYTKRMEETTCGM